VAVVRGGRAGAHRNRALLRRLCLRALSATRYGGHGSSASAEPRFGQALAELPCSWTARSPSPARGRPHCTTWVIARARRRGANHMPEERTKRRAQTAKAQGKSPTTQAGEFVREEIHHVREGKHGARSTKQAIAIGLSKARRAGVDLPPPAPGKAPERTRRSARRALARGREAPPRAPSARRTRAVLGALKREGRSAASSRALSEQARTAAGRRSARERSQAAQKAVRTKGARTRKSAAKKAARTRAARQHGA
jgi:hypothetical protein